MRSDPSLHCRTLGFVAVSLAALFAHAQEPVSVDDPRPLAKVADALELRFGIPVDYEDAEYVWEGDLTDVTKSVARPGYLKRHPGLRILGPRAGSLVLTLPARTAGAAKLTIAEGGRQAVAPLESAIELHAGKDLPGRFQVHSTPGRLSIVPVAVKDGEGRLTKASPVLDALITLPVKQRTGLQIIEAICQQVSAVTGKKVGEGMTPFNLLRGTVVTMGAVNEPARDVLARAFANLQNGEWSAAQIPLLSWRLFYGPEIEAYVLNIRGVQVQEPAPFGGLVTRLVLRQ